MIQKLRRKFIFINMGLVTLVLLIVFFGICYSSHRRLEGESMVAMRQAVQLNGDKLPPKLEAGGKKPQKPPSMIPIFCVMLDSFGGVITVKADNIEVTDELAQQAATMAMESESNVGIISTLDLRYLREETRDGLKIAFADRSSEHSAMASLYVSSVLVGLGGLAAFLLVSLYLSRWALRPVEKAWEQQRQFVADASHELKTPLTVILANTNILLTHKQDPISQQVKWVEYTRDEANRMKGLVNDLLYLAKSDSAQSVTIRSELDLSDLTWSCLLPFESVAFELGVALESDISPSLPVLADEGQLKQLLAILLDNACKFAGKGGEVKINLSHMQNKAKLTVSNTGAWISPEHIDHLFERFYRVDKSRVREEGGYGLGLAIAQSIVVGHKGRIAVESTEEAGTTFIVNLPLI